MNILLVEDNPADMRLVREAVAEHALDATLHWRRLWSLRAKPLAGSPKIVRRRSSSAEPADVLRAYRSHGNAYVVKPNDFEQFVELVGRIQSYWFEAVRLPSQAG